MSSNGVINLASLDHFRENRRRRREILSRTRTQRSVELGECSCCDMNMSRSSLGSFYKVLNYIFACSQGSKRSRFAYDHSMCQMSQGEGERCWLQQSDIVFQESERKSSHDHAGTSTSGTWMHLFCSIFFTIYLSNFITL